MNSYLAVTSRYLKSHRKNTRLTILSVVISVMLVTAIFSMLDVFRQFETRQIINDFGNYHIIVKNVTDEEAENISSRIDVDAAAKYMEFSGVKMDGIPVEIANIEGIPLVYSSNFSIVDGSTPQKSNEVVIEQWAAESYKLNVGGSVELTSEDGTQREFIISGICTDFSGTKAEEVPGLLVTLDGAQSIKPDEGICLIVRFKNHVNVNRTQKEIQRQFGLSDDQFSHNERLLAMMGQSINSTVLGLYATGAFFFILVLIAGVTMIYNTFNISVMNRIRQFGLLRCIGASKKQIRKLVRKEGRIVALKAIPPGVVIGMIVTVACSAILKYFNSSFFADIPLISVSFIGIAAGIIVGMLTIFIASRSPAKKASRVSPVNAVSGGEAQSSKKRKKGLLTSIFHVETALGIGNAVSRKKTLFLMSASIAISIILFLGFQVYISFVYSSLKVLKPYTPDIEVISDSGLDYSLYQKLSALDGVKHVYGRMFGYVDATFDASRLTDEYKQTVGDIAVNADGTFIPTEKSWLISYDKNQLNWAKTDLIKGTLSEKKLNAGNGIIAVVINSRNSVSMDTADLQLGDKVKIQTVSGEKEYTVMAILRKVPFVDSNLNLATFITTEKLYTEITGDSDLDAIDIQLKNGNQEQAVSEIKNMAGDQVKFLDKRQENTEDKQAFLTAALFAYGFVAVIGFISVLNIINTMQTSVSAKMRYFGVMRAVGMSGRQLGRMIIFEAGTYGLLGCTSGIILGIVLQKFIVTDILSDVHISWNFPLIQIIIIFAVVFAVTIISAVGPLRKIKSEGIYEIIGSMQ